MEDTSSLLPDCAVQEELYGMQFPEWRFSLMVRHSGVELSIWFKISKYQEDDNPDYPTSTVRWNVTYRDQRLKSYVIH